MDLELLKVYSKKLIHTVHRLDKNGEPFKNDEEYEAYLFEIERLLFRFWEDGLRASEQ